MAADLVGRVVAVIATPDTTAGTLAATAATTTTTVPDRVQHRLRPAQLGLAVAIMAPDWPGRPAPCDRYFGSDHPRRRLDRLAAVDEAVPDAIVARATRSGGGADDVGNLGRRERRRHRQHQSGESVYLRACSACPPPVHDAITAAPDDLAVGGRDHVGLEQLLRPFAGSPAGVDVRIGQRP